MRALLTRLIVAPAAMLALSAAVRAASLMPDGVALTFGQGDNVFVSGAAAYWNSLCECAELKDKGFDTRLVAQLSYWHAQQHPTANGPVWDSSITPVLRWLAPFATTVQPFLELGVGAHLLSHTRINDERVFSTAFQFGENGGAGIAFGEHHRFELGVYIQHVSNGSIKEPNNGLTYFGGVLRMALF